MSEITSLYRECEVVFRSLKHKHGGTHGHHEGGKEVTDGIIIDGFKGRDLVMSLHDHQDPSHRSFALGVLGKRGEVHVFADPSVWPHKLTVMGATEKEVRNYLRTFRT